MKPLANEKTCSNSAIGLEIESATCVGDTSKSQGKAKPQVGSHTAEKERARHAKARRHARSDAKAEGRTIAGFTPLPQRPIDAFLPYMHKILEPRENGPRRLGASFVQCDAMLTSCCQPMFIEVPSCGIVHL